MPITPKRNIIAFEMLPVELPKKDYEITYSNPQYWEMDGVRNKFHFIYAPSFPHIEEAYEKAGKEVYRPEEQSGEEPIKTPDPVPHISDDGAVSVEGTEDNVVKEEDFQVKPAWREMSPMEVRDYAKQFTDEKVKNKEQAKEILEALEAEGRL